MVGLAHPSIPINDLFRNVHNTSLQRHLLTADTTMVASTALAIEKYLAVGAVNCVDCKLVERKHLLGQLA